MKPVLEFLGMVLKKDGVIGVLLVLLLGQNYMAEKRAAERFERAANGARAERQEAALAYRALSDSVIALARMQAASEARTTVVIESFTRASRDNTRVLREHSRRLGWRSSQDG